MCNDEATMKMTRALTGLAGALMLQAVCWGTIFRKKPIPALPVGVTLEKAALIGRIG